MSTEHARAQPSEMELLKGRLKSTWETGDYGHFASYLESGAMAFLNRIRIRPGDSVLDVACGNGQISIPAVRAGARVTGLDLAENLIEQARNRARDEGLAIDFEQGDAEALPYEDDAFEVVMSLFGAMFAPRPDRVAAELLRVCRPGGRIVMGNWTPEGFIGRMFRIIGRHAPPPPLMAPPVQWGDPLTVQDRLGLDMQNLEMIRHLYPLDYPFPPAKVVEFFRRYYGPLNRAFAGLDAPGQEKLRKELEIHWARHNRAGTGRTHVEAEYLQVTAFVD